MMESLPLTLLLFIILLAVPPSEEHQLQPDAVCLKIGKAISSASDVYYKGHPLYEKGIYHWANSSSQQSACVVEAGSTADIGIILRKVKKYCTPFAIKGGGHASNPGFSSTTGVHISMARFSEVTYDAASQTVVVGAGLIWDDVYAALAPYNISVVGGRVTGVGVAGLLLGGGFSWKTNQYGLAVDNVVAFELVKPDGRVAVVTQHSDHELFFGLKGGFNNFGIVTRFTLKAFPQTEVWGGLGIYGAPAIPELSSATATFLENIKDPKASVITTYNFMHGAPVTTLLLFYDAPTAPEGMFDQFLGIPSVLKDFGPRSYLSMVQASPANATAGQRGVFNTVSVLGYTTPFIDIIVNETLFWGTQLQNSSGTFASYAVEPFLPDLYSHSNVSTAFPFSRSTGVLPLNIYYAWTDPEQDQLFYDTIHGSAATIYNAAVAGGQSDIVGAPVYSNLAIFDTPLEQLYGSNLPALRALKARIDPSNVMGLTGGFKL